jgi:hypothetical protein
VESDAAIRKLIRFGPLGFLLLCAAGPCPVGQSSYWLQLFFGRTAVNDVEWRDFVEKNIAPAFPDGFTIVDAQGAWRAPGSTRTLSEPSAVLLIAAPDTPEVLARVETLIDAYKQRFHQQSVGLTVQDVCARF